MKLINNIKLNGKIELVTALHIGAGNENIEIGGLDLPVIKNPKNDMPYIPGSSLKGKMRFLSEWKENKVVDNNVHGKNCKENNCKICKIFGTTEHETMRGPTRLIVRDAYIKNWKNINRTSLLEVKYENTINRLSGTAKNPRPIERVIPGTNFEFEIVYRVFDLDDGGNSDNENFKLVLEAMKMLENDTLGGSGSRGCGKIAFKNITVSGSENLDNEGKEYNEMKELIEKAGV